MLDEIEQQELVAFVMADPQKRLEIAVAAYWAYEKIRAEVIRKFIQELAHRLSEALSPTDGWIIDATDQLNRPFEKDRNLRIRKDAWPPGIAVCLGAEENGPRTLWMGVKTPASHPQFDIIRDQLNKALGQGMTYEGNTEYPWYRHFDPRWNDWKLGDWRQPWAILALGEGGNGDYGDYLYETLITISRALASGWQPIA